MLFEGHLACFRSLALFPRIETVNMAEQVSVEQVEQAVSLAHMGD